MERALAEVTAELEARRDDIRVLQEALRHAEQRATDAEALRDEIAAAQGAREAAHALELATMQAARDAALAREQQARERLDGLRLQLDRALTEED